MTNRPYMPLYIADYLSATEHLDAVHSGAYLHLIMHYWQKGFLPKEDKFLARIARMTDRQWASAKATIKAFFRDDWTHERVENEIAHAEKKARARATSGQRGGLSKSLNYKKPVLANASTLPEQTASKLVSKPLPSSSGLELEEEPSGSSNLCANQIFSGQTISRERTSLKSDFDSFFLAYPKRINRKGAAARYEAARRAGVSHETIMAGEKRWIEKWAFDRVELQFVPAPDVWLNKEKYNDEVPPNSRDGPTNGANGQSGHPLNFGSKTHAGKAKTPSDFLRAEIERSRDARSAAEPIDMLT